MKFLSVHNKRYKKEILWFEVINKILLLDTVPTLPNREEKTPEKRIISYNRSTREEILVIDGEYKEKVSR